MRPARKRASDPRTRVVRTTPLRDAVTMACRAGFFVRTTPWNFAAAAVAGSATVIAASPAAASTRIFFIGRCLLWTAEPAGGCAGGRLYGSIRMRDRAAAALLLVPSIGANGRRLAETP